MSIASDWLSNPSTNNVKLLAESDDAEVVLRLSSNSIVMVFPSMPTEAVVAFGADWSISLGLTVELLSNNCENFGTKFKFPDWSCNRPELSVSLDHIDLLPQAHLRLVSLEPSSR